MCFISIGECSRYLSMEASRADFSIRPTESDDGLRKRVFILYTGGTVGMRPGPDGSLRPQKGFLNQKFSELDELKNARMPKCTVKEFDTLIDSSDISPADWAEIVTVIGDKYYEYDGFVVIHGTDTMAYTASALSFMLENLAKPVVLTGSILPFGEVHSDARRNLVVSVLIAANSNIPEVCVFFNDSLLRGNRAVKVDSSGLASFTSPNYPPLATLGVDIRFNDHLLAPPPRGRLVVHSRMDPSILVIRLVPGFVDLEAMAPDLSKLKAVVLLLYGTGNAPSRKQSFVNWVSQLIKKGIFVVAVSQCQRGSVDLEKYHVGLQLQQVGVFSAFDMTCEASVTKLSYLLARGLSRSQMSIALESSLRGEMGFGRDQAAQHLMRGIGGFVARL